MDQENYGKLVGGIDQYSVPLMDMFLFVYDQMQEGYVTLDEEMTADIEDLHTQLVDAQKQLKGEHYSRMVLELALPEESQETFDFLDTLHQTAEEVTIPKGCCWWATPPVTGTFRNPLCRITCSSAS